MLLLLLDGRTHDWTALGFAGEIAGEAIGSGVAKGGELLGGVAAEEGTRLPVLGEIAQVHWGLLVEVIMKESAKCEDYDWRAMTQVKNKKQEF